jgi:hypothetical protein
MSDRGETEEDEIPPLPPDAAPCSSLEWTQEIGSVAPVLSQSSPSEDPAVFR